MTVSVDLQGSSLTALKSHADQLGVPLEALAQTVLADFAASLTPDERKKKFERAMEGSLQDNDELYKRLAQ